MTCECVVAFEKLPWLLGEDSSGSASVPHRNGGHYSTIDPLPEPLRGMYRLDGVLWRLAANESHLCSRPEPMPWARK